MILAEAPLGDRQTCLQNRSFTKFLVRPLEVVVRVKSLSLSLSPSVSLCLCLFLSLSVSLCLCLSDFDNTCVVFVQSDRLSAQTTTVSEVMFVQCELLPKPQLFMGFETTDSIGKAPGDCEISTNSYCPPGLLATVSKVFLLPIPDRRIDFSLQR